MQRVAAGAALLCLASACATPLAYRPLSEHDPRPRQLLDVWVERAAERQRLRALARLAVERADGSASLRGKQLVVLERPSRMRVEILGFLNQSLAVIATDGEGFEVYRAEDRSYESGVADERLLRDEAGIDLSPEEAVAVLLGVPISEPLPAPARALGDADGWVRIDLTAGPDIAAQRVTFDAEGRLRALEVLGDSGATVWSAHFDAYRDVEGAAFAHSIALDVHSGATRAEISFRDVELNPELPPGLFRLFRGAGGAPPGAGGR